MAHSYDATGKLGQLSTKTDAQGRVITYAYTHRGQLYTVSESGTGAVSGTTTYVYDNSGNETGITNPNTTTVTKGYDVANPLTSVTNKNSSATVLSSYTITPSADSRNIGISESGGSAVTYGYDALGHLTSDVRTGTNAYSKSRTGSSSDPYMYAAPSGAGAPSRGEVRAGWVLLLGPQGRWLLRHPAGSFMARPDRPCSSSLST